MPIVVWFSSLITRSCIQLPMPPTRWMRVLVLCGAALMVRVSAAADLSGSYIAQITTTPTAEPQFARVSIKVDDTAVSGMWGDYKISGTLAGPRLTLSLTDAE